MIIYPINRNCLENVARQMINIINKWRIVEHQKIMDWKCHCQQNPERVINEIVMVLKEIKNRRV